MHTHISTTQMYHKLETISVIVEVREELVEVPFEDAEQDLVDIDPQGIDVVTIDILLQDVKLVKVTVSVNRTVTMGFLSVSPALTNQSTVFFLAPGTVGMLVNSPFLAPFPAILRTLYSRAFQKEVCSTP